MNSKKLQARDFITIGIFTALLWVVQMVVSTSVSGSRFCIFCPPG